MPEYVINVEYEVKISAKDAETAVNIAAERTPKKLELKRATEIKEGTRR